MLEAESEHAPEPVKNWARTNLANYIRKDFGAPTDPLLELEKEMPGLHLPEDELGQFEGVVGRVNQMPAKIPSSWLSPQMHGQTGVAAKIAATHRALTDQPLTPWGYKTGEALSSLTPLEYAAEIVGTPGAPPRELLAKLGPKHAWLEKASPDTKIWGLQDTGEDDFGFGHVLDYLDAATEAQKAAKLYGSTAKMREVGRAVRTRPQLLSQADIHDAGLALDPASLSRLSVQDAVRKTAEWNKLLAEGMGAEPGLAKGWKEFKTYPEDPKGMKWV
jgi:hypothetical protein